MEDAEAKGEAGGPTRPFKRLQSRSQDGRIVPRRRVASVRIMADQHCLSTCKRHEKDNSTSDRAEPARHRQRKQGELCFLTHLGPVRSLFFQLWHFDVNAEPG